MRARGASTGGTGAGCSRRHAGTQARRGGAAAAAGQRGAVAQQAPYLYIARQLFLRGAGLGGVPVVLPQRARFDEIERARFDEIEATGSSL